MFTHGAPRTSTDATSIGLLVLRLAVGGFLLPHGLGKLFGWFGGPGLAGFAGELQQFDLPSAAPLPLLLAALQTALGLMVVAGAFTRIAAVGAAAFLAVTVALNLSHGWFWMHGGIEYPMLWLWAHVAIALTGPGTLSIDAARRGSAHGH